MDGTEYTRKLVELDHLFNDSEAPAQPQKLWSLLAELAEHDLREPSVHSTEH